MRGKLTISLLAAVCCVSFVGVAHAQQLNASIEASFMSKYMWHGFETFGNKAGSGLDLNIDFGDTGLYFGAQYLTPNGSGGVNISDFNRYPAEHGSLVDRAKYIYYAGYKFTVLDAEAFETDFDFKYQYHDYYRTSSAVLDQHEFSLLAEWKNLIGNGFMPYYEVTYLSDADSGWGKYDPVHIGPNPPSQPLPATLYGNDQNSNIKGWLHKVGLAYDMPLYMPELGIDNVRFFADAVYNDGAWGTSKASADLGTSVGAGSEWTHITYGAETGMNLGFGKMGMGVYYQHAIADDYSNLTNTFYSTLSYKIEF